jgi:ubiquinone/menaquinone biosynthesis C-methylase UbiE
MNSTNFGIVTESYARSRNDIPHEIFESLLLRNIHFGGKKVVDIGCGTGALTRKLKIRKADVVGVDTSLELIQKARDLSKEEYSPIEYQLGTAENTGLTEDTYHIATVLRAWHWFKRDEAIKEIKRILKPKGTLLVMDSGFTGESAVVAQTFSIMNKYIPGGIRPAGSKAVSRQRINGYPVEWFEEWKQHQLELHDFYKFNYSVGFTNEEWIDRISSLSWMVEMNEIDRKTSLEDLLQTLNQQYGTNAKHIIPHFFTVCILSNAENQ